MSDETNIQPALTAEQWAMDGTHAPVLLNGKDASRRVYFRQPKISKKYPGMHLDEGFGVELNADNSLSVWDDSWGIVVESSIRHGVAALCLYGQPYGFTREDVAFLRDMQAQAIRGRGGVQAHRFGRIADRIEALLPPA